MLHHVLCGHIRPSGGGAAVAGSLFLSDASAGAASVAILDRDTLAVLLSVASPDSVPLGIGGNTAVVWHTSRGTNTRVYELDPVDLSVVRFADSPNSLPYGMGGKADYIIHTGQSPLRRYVLSVVDFAVITEVTSGPGTAGCGGNSTAAYFAVDPGSPGRINTVNPTTLAVTTGVDSPTAAPVGLGGDNLHAWHVEIATNRIYEFDPVNFASVLSFTASPTATPRDIGGIST